MNLLILDSGHAKNTAGKNNAKENFYEWQFNNDMQYKKLYFNTPSLNCKTR